MSRDELYLRHILDAVEIIRTYAEAGEAAFHSDQMRQDAIVPRLEIIGEATKQLTRESRQEQPQIPWRRIAGMRDRLIHGYAGVDLHAVWSVVATDLAPLEQAVRSLLREE